MVFSDKNEDNANNNCYKKEEWEERHENTWIEVIFLIWGRDSQTMKCEPSIWTQEKLINSSDAHSLSGICSGWCEICLIKAGNNWSRPLPAQHPHVTQNAILSLAVASVFSG